MRYYSDKLEEFFDTEAELLAAESNNDAVSKAYKKWQSYSVGGDVYLSLSDTIDKIRDDTDKAIQGIMNKAKNDCEILKEDSENDIESLREHFCRDANKYYSEYKKLLKDSTYSKMKSNTVFCDELPVNDDVRLPSFSEVLLKLLHGW